MFSFKSILYCSHNSGCHFSRIDLSNNNSLQLVLFYSIDLYSRDLRTIIVLFSNNVPLHKADWILSELPLPTLSCLLYCIVRSLMSALQAEWNLYKCKQVACTLLVYVFIHLFVVGCLLFNFPFLLLLLLYFRLFINHVNKNFFWSIILIVLRTPFLFS